MRTTPFGLDAVGVAIRAALVATDGTAALRPPNAPVIVFVQLFVAEQMNIRPAPSKAICPTKQGVEDEAGALSE
jgi:hypothetical protein